ncbi:MAG TPA: lamin tail domain-containing protein [Flavobacteriales bacterium]|nr:lamin tail domain-containing protein [Flavobacteriales bacterium]
MCNRPLAIASLLAFFSLHTSAQTAGDVVITEIMADPESVTDANGEWFEVYNHTSGTVHMQNWHIKDGGANDVTISGVLDLPPDAIIVIGRNSDVTANGGLVVDYACAFPLANGSGDVILTTSGGTVIDAVHYTTTYPGASTSLMNAHWNATDNDNTTFWCASTSLYNNTDHGTPHQTNNTCVVGIEESAALPITWRITNDELLITVSNGTHAWAIVDASGRQVESGKASSGAGSISIAIGRLAQGTYFFQLNGRAFRFVRD